ncbi:hypothetical protein J2I47_21420 [Fibrella sp. HMF5335]|uniref:Uncharacterized protein n=1 Tax=Fibrella rubiginis TaxID=2817060 RepID=A0A939K557_9BACT|nr:hypothetical protein [Fibrella rubiginis]MBO0939129.1 hypothetical protein [Fibrella rubiginis]
MDDPFSMSAVQARLGLLRQLGTYAERLSTLSGNKAPEQFQTNTASLANSLKALQGTFVSLSAINGTNDAARYVGPLGTIVGIVGKLALDQKRDEALRKAIIDGEQPVNQLLDFLKEDLDKYVATTRLAGMAQQLSTASLFYNGEKNSLTREQRQLRLAEIAQLAEAYKLLQTASPSSVVRQMKITHQTLVQATKENSPLSAGLVLGTIDEYESSVAGLLDAIQQLHAINQTKQ